MSRSFAPHLLTRAGQRPAAPARAAVRFLGDFGLARARVHEICGTARRTLALTVARAMEGPVFWITPAWEPARLNGAALPGWIDPARLILLTPKRAEDLLWTMEEVLRSGAVPLVVADLPAPPALTPVRRLHLAAETGAAEGDVAPVGLLLTATRTGAPGVESRWGFRPTHEGDRTQAWRLDRLRARTDPPASWRVVPGARGGLVVKEKMGVEDQLAAD